MTADFYLELRWYAIKVRPGHEKTVAAGLRNKGIEQFLPLYRSRRFWSDRIKELELPLFSGYLFCRFASQNRLPIFTTPGVTSIVGYGNTPAALPDKEIADLMTLVSSGLQLSPWPFLKIGQKVHIDRGPLKGIDGAVLQIKDSSRLIVSISLLQRSVAVEIESAVLRPQQEAAPYLVLERI